MKKLLFLTALISFCASAAQAEEALRPFMIATDYTLLYAQAMPKKNIFQEAVPQENPYEKTESTPAEISASDVEEKWDTTIKDLKRPKTRSISGGTAFGAGDGVSIGVTAGYEEIPTVDRMGINETHSLGLNIQLAL